jgi:chromosome segregation protein
MRLKKLEIVGFKSFSEKAAIQFPAGISAIVGPNGCGKSNIVDALRWAMGEQSVKQLRGRAMEDVIFAGTNGKQPLNMAEVSLVLVNDNGTAPEPLKHFTEIMLTRRLYRSGESAYLINKQPCRLKDIHGIFMGSGMGARSYAVIQQGNIGAITDAGPEERRNYIEEAAGITLYKTRKKETLQKLESTQQNLLRVKDIASEVERQMNSLKRQAQKAVRYKKYQQESMILDLRLSDRECGAISQTIQKNDSLLKELRDQDIETAAKLKKLDAAIEDIKFQLEQKGQEISDRKTARFELQRDIDRMENDLAHLRKDSQRLETEIRNFQTTREELEGKNQGMLGEIAEGQARIKTLEDNIQEVRADMERENQDSRQARAGLAGLNQEMEAARSRYAELAGQEARHKTIHQTVMNNKDSLKRRLKRLDEETALAARKAGELETREAEVRAEADQCAREIAEIEAEIRAARETVNEKNRELAAQVKAVQTLEFERNKIRSRHGALKKMADNFEWYRDGVKAVMKRPDPDGQVMGLIADILEPAPSYQAAVEAVLGESLQYVIVKDPKAAAASMDYLKTQNAGRGGFVPVSAVKTPETPALGPDDLLNHVRIKPGFEAVGQMLLGQVVISDDLTAALAGHSQNRGRTFVTPGGDVVLPQGLMIGGSPDKLSGILAKKQELRELEHSLAGMDRNLEAERARQKDMESQVMDLDRRIQKLTEAKNRALESETSAQRELYKAVEALKHARRDLEMFNLEQDELANQAENLDAEAGKAQALLARIAREVEDTQNAVTGISEKINQAAEEVGAFERRIMDIKLRLTTLQHEQENSRNTVRRLKEFQQDALARLGQLTGEIQAKDRKKQTTEAEIVQTHQKLFEKYEDIKTIDADIHTQEAAFHQIDERLKQGGQSASQVKTQREEVLQKIRMVELEQAQQKMKREHIENRVLERYHRPLAEFRPELSASEYGQGMEAPEIEEALAELRKKIQGIGDVNLGAIAEYEELKQRYDFLTEQQADLVRAIDDLHKVIQKINQVSQERFLATFEQINQKLEDVFPRLFGGGSARLVLSEPDKPLESGVEFMVQPPGKKLARLSLLSGGEKALAAIAFVFSIFLIKPAAFCILDEIDAPLDEANVMRFNELLKVIGEKSQIIMITHKKKSMEFADTLFGITMEQKGESKVVSVNFTSAEDMGIDDPE